MWTFIKIHQYEIIYVIVTVLVTATLILLTTFLQKRTEKRHQKKYGLDNDGSSKMVRRILNILWLILGITSVIILFVSDEVKQTLIDNSKYIIYSTIVVISTIIFASLTNRWFQWKAQKKSEENDDPTSLKFLRYLAIGSIYTVGALLILLVLPGFKGVAQTVLGGAGVIAVIAGIASQEALGNIVSGLFIVSFKPFKIGDIIKIEGGMMGTVQDITLRHTVIQNFENQMIVVPNSVINKEKLVNYNSLDKKICVRLEIGISYDSDIDLAKNIMREEAEKHPLLIEKRTLKEIKDKAPKVPVKMVQLSDSSVILRVYAWTANPDDGWTLRYDILESIKKRFDKEGVEIPYPHRTVYFKNPLKREE